MKVVEQFKKRILDLAIHGKLVPQDPNDEPASVLIERIYAEREKAGKGKKGKRKNLPSHAELGDLQSHAEPQGRGEGCWSHTEAQRHGGISDPRLDIAGGSRSCAPSAPFPIPDSWEWVRLGEVFQHNTGKALNRSNAKGTPHEYITTSNVYWDEFKLDGLKQMPFTDEELEKCTVRKGDLLICEGGDIGRAAIWNLDASVCIQNHLHRLRPFAEVCVPYFCFVLRMYKMSNRLQGKGIGLQGFSSGMVHNLPIPLPPLAEQKRIVAKVEELFKVADALGEAADGLEATAQRLERKILDLAIRGRLVPQDPADEPATELLKRVTAERQALIKVGKLKAGKAEAALFRTSDRPAYETCDERPPHAEERGGISDPRLNLAGGSRSCATAAPFPIPDSWEWVRLGEVCEIQLGKMLDKGKNRGTPYSYLANQSVRWRTFDLSSLKTMPFTDAEVEKFALLPGDILMCEGGVPGRCAIWREAKTNIKYQKAVHRIRSHHVQPEYVQIFFEAVHEERFFKDCFTGTTIKHLPRETLLLFPIPLPPLEEQKRIVAKVEEITALLNTLKRLFQQ